MSMYCLTTCGGLFEWEEVRTIPMLPVGMERLFYMCEGSWNDGVDALKIDDKHHGKLCIMRRPVRSALKKAGDLFQDAYNSDGEELEDAGEIRDRRQSSAHERGKGQKVRFEPNKTVPRYILYLRQRIKVVGDKEYITDEKELAVVQEAIKREEESGTIEGVERKRSVMGRFSNIFGSGDRRGSARLSAIFGAGDRRGSTRLSNIFGGARGQRSSTMGGRGSVARGNRGSVANRSSVADRGSVFRRLSTAMFGGRETDSEEEEEEWESESEDEFVLGERLQLAETCNYVEEVEKRQRKSSVTQEGTVLIPVAEGEPPAEGNGTPRAVVGGGGGARTIEVARKPQAGDEGSEEGVRRQSGTGKVRKLSSDVMAEIVAAEAMAR